MDDARDSASAAGRKLAAARWGAVRLDKMISELSARADELGPVQIQRLQSLVGDAPTSTMEDQK